MHGLPKELRLDNDSELTNHAFVDWAKDRGIALRIIEPGKPNYNAYIERFNKTYRNGLRPHDSLGRVPPLTYMPRVNTAGESNFHL